MQRLKEFGADPDAVADHFDYVQPETRADSAEERAAWNQMLARKYALAVIDGVTDALGIFGYGTKDNDDVSRWMREVPKAIASRTGAAVVLIDHVTKDSGTRGRYAIGGQAKMAGLTGAAYTVEVSSPLGRGLRGVVVMRVGKDRPGAVRALCGRFRSSDRTQEAAKIVVDSTCSPPQVTVEAPSHIGEVEGDQSNEFRPTNLMQRVSETIEQHPGELTKNKAAQAAGGKKAHTLMAIDILAAEDYLITEQGKAGYPVYRSFIPYREKEDKKSDRYVDSGNSSPTVEVVPGSRSLDQGTGKPVPTPSPEPNGTNGNHQAPPSKKAPQSASPVCRGPNVSGSVTFPGTEENQRRTTGVRPWGA